MPILTIKIAIKYTAYADIYTNVYGKVTIQLKTLTIKLTITTECDVQVCLRLFLY